MSGLNHQPEEPHTISGDEGVGLTKQSHQQNVRDLNTAAGDPEVRLNDASGGTTYGLNVCGEASATAVECGSSLDSTEVGSGSDIVNKEGECGSDIVNTAIECGSSFVNTEVEVESNTNNTNSTSIGSGSECGPTNVTITDRSGNKMMLVKECGVYFPMIDHMPGVRQFYENASILSKLEVNDGDVLLMAYPRSGTHWLDELTGMIMKGNSQPMEGAKELRMLEASPLDDINKITSPKLMTSHYWPHMFPKRTLQRLKILHVVRDPRDSIASLYNLLRVVEKVPYTGSFGDFVDLFLQGKTAFGSWFDYENEYEAMCRDNFKYEPLMVYYEDLIRDPIPTLKMVSQFLGIEPDEDLMRRIIDACHIDKMRENATKGKFHYRKGKTGDWKNWFTVADKEKFDEVYRTRMVGSWLKFDL